MGRIFRKCETRLQWILTCIKRQKITGTMKTVYLVCLVAAGAAFAFAADYCNRNDGGCVPVITDPDPVNPGKGEGEACASFPDMPEAAPTEGPSKTPCLDKKTEAGEKGDFVSCAEAGKYAGFFEATQTKDKYR